MKIDKVKYDFYNEQRRFLGAKFVDDVKNGMRWVYRTQTAYDVSFECVGINDKDMLVAACKLFHSVPEGIRRNIGSIQMSPEPQVYWRVEPNITAKMLVDIGWERLVKMLGLMIKPLGKDDTEYDDDDDGSDDNDEEDKMTLEHNKVSHASMDNFSKRNETEDDKEDDEWDDEEQKKPIRKIQSKSLMGLVSVTAKPGLQKVIDQMTKGEVTVDEISGTGQSKRMSQKEMEKFFGFKPSKADIKAVTQKKYNPKKYVRADNKLGQQLKRSIDLERRKKARREKLQGKS